VSYNNSEHYKITHICHPYNLKVLTSAIIISLFAVGNKSYAQECSSSTNGSYIPTNLAACTINPDNNPKFDSINGIINLDNTGFFIMNRNLSNSDTNVNGDLKVRALNEKGQFAAIANQYRSNKNLNLNNVDIEYNSNGNSVGLDTNTLNNITANDVTLKAHVQKNSKEVYGLLAGSSINSGEKDTSNNGKYSSIKVNNLTINQSAEKGKVGPTLNAGLRSIQGATDDTNGSAGKIIINGTLNMNLTGERMEGIYVSGSAEDNSGNEAVSQVVLKGDSNIILNQINNFDNQSSAIKIGKSRAVGTGKGAVYSEGSMNIDSSAAVGDAIKLYGSGSLLKADYANSKIQIKANKSAIIVGGSDWQEPANHQSSDNAVYLKDAKLESITSTASLIKIYDNQKNFTFSVVGDETDIVASENGWLMEIGAGENIKIEGDTHALFSGQGSMRGMTTINGSRLDMNLTDGFTWNLQKRDTDTTTSFSTLSMQNGAIVNAFDLLNTSEFTMKGDIHSSFSTINMSNGIIGDELTILGNYTGDNARLLIDSRWDNPDLQQTDHLIITGTSSGMTVVSVPEGIIGDVTQGDLPKNGQWQTPVVSVRGDDQQKPKTFSGVAETTNAGQAQLVQRNSDNGESNYYWTLAAMPPSPNPNPDPNPNPTPIYTLGTSGYVQMSRINREMGLDQLGKLHERIGERQTWVWDDCGQRCGQYRQKVVDSERPYPIWGRMSYSDLKEQGNNRFGYTTKRGFFQFGTDLRVNTDEDSNHQHLGIMFSYSHGKHDFYDKYRAQDGVVTNQKQVGSGTSDMYSLGTYSTWYQANGTYLDLVGNISGIHNNYESASGQTSQNGYGVGASAEIGRPWQLGDSHWQIEPQAQISYQYVYLNDFNDDVRMVDGQSGGTMRGRIGARLAYNQNNDQERTNTFYVTANILHDLSGNESKAKIGRDDLRETYKRTWGELGAGAQLPLGKATYLFGDMRYAHSFGSSTQVFRGNDTARENISGHIGLRYSW
ncbi:autotransporter outer membrane beta-barrel domain-containing protein, partial [Morganella morganii]